MATQRAADGEKVKKNIIDEKKLVTIMKRFLGTKETDPEITKFFRVEDGINFMATTLGSAVSIYFRNRFGGSFEKGTGVDFFRKPMANSQFEDTEFIAEMETITDGKKKIKKPTGRFLEYPNVSAMFNSFDLERFLCIEISPDQLDDFIAVHEAMEKAAKIGGTYNTARLEVDTEGLIFSIYDSPLDFVWKYKVDEGIHSYYKMVYHYNFSYMTNIFKSIKDLKVDKIQMYFKDEFSPIVFAGRTTDYDYNFALNRKLVGNAKE